MTATRRPVTPWIVLALVAEALLVVGGLTSDETFTTAYVLVPLALALVEPPRPVAVLGVLAMALAVASGLWNDHLLSWGHVLRCSIVAVGAVLAVLSAQARFALFRSQRQGTTAREQAEATGRRLDAILGALAEAVTVHDDRGATTYANGAAVRLLGAESLDEVLNAAPGELVDRFVITKEDGSPVEEGDFPGQRAVLGEPAAPMLTRSVLKSTGHSYWLLTKASVVNDEHGRPLAVNVIEDVTEAKEAEIRQRFLARATQLLASSLDYDETLERVAWLAVPDFADWCGVDLLEGGSIERVALAHADPEKLGLGRMLSDEYPADITADTGLPAVVRSGKAEVYPVISDAMIEAGARDARHLDLIRGLGMRSAMVAPMKTGGATIGALTFVNAGSGRVFDAGDLAFAEELAARAATAVDNSRLYTRLAQTAQTLQASLLPDRLAQPPGWRVAASYVAGESGTEVGGDFYDVFPVEDSWMVVLGDVTGKGVRAAALTSLARHTAKTAARFDPRPGAVLSRVNEVLRERPELSLVTAVCARLRPVGEGAEVSLASAGHPLPLRVTPRGEVTPVGDFDVVLGAVDDGTWDESTATLRPGDTLLLYTDGVTDMPGEGDRFGDDRLFEAAAAGPSAAPDLIARIERALDDFQTRDVSDDRAMLAIEWIGVTEPAVTGR